MLSKKERVLALLKAGMDEMHLLLEMIRDIRNPATSFPMNMAMWIPRESSIPLRQASRSCWKSRE